MLEATTEYGTLGYHVLWCQQRVRIRLGDMTLPGATSHVDPATTSNPTMKRDQ